MGSVVMATLFVCASNAWEAASSSLATELAPTGGEEVPPAWGLPSLMASLLEQREPSWQQHSSAVMPEGSRVMQVMQAVLFRLGGCFEVEYRSQRKYSYSLWLRFSRNRAALSHVSDLIFVILWALA